MKGHSSTLYITYPIVDKGGLYTLWQVWEEGTDRNIYYSLIKTFWRTKLEDEKKMDS